jgi:hypothetical protein
MWPVRRPWRLAQRRRRPADGTHVRVVDIAERHGTTTVALLRACAAAGIVVYDPLADLDPGRVSAVEAVAAGATAGRPAPAPMPSSGPAVTAPEARLAPSTAPTVVDHPAPLVPGLDPVHLVDEPVGRPTGTTPADDTPGHGSLTDPTAGFAVFVPSTPASAEPPVRRRPPRDRRRTLTIAALGTAAVLVLGMVGWELRGPEEVASAPTPPVATTAPTPATDATATTAPTTTADGSLAGAGTTPTSATTAPAPPTTAASLTATLDVGSCVSLPSPPTGTQTTTVPSLEVVPCDGPHTFEVYLVFEIEAGSDSPWPGDEVVVNAADARCVEAFDAFIGVPYAESEFQIRFIRPTEASWASTGDRRIVCGVVSADGSDRTGTARDARR